MAPEPQRRPASEDDRSPNDDLNSLGGIQGSATSNTYHGIQSALLADLAERTSLMSTYPIDGATYSDGPELVLWNQERMSTYIRQFDLFFDSGLGTVPAGPSTRPNVVQVFPARIRLPGENLPYRLEDGGSTTQPRRGSRRRSAHANQSPAPSQTGDDPPMAPRIRANSPAALPPPINWGPTADFFAPEDSLKGKRKARAHIDFSKHSAPLSAPDIQKQQGFSSGAFANPSPGAPAPSASYQQFDQLSQMPPEQPGILHCSAQPDQLPVWLPNSMVWKPHLGLFDQGQLGDQQQRLPTPDLPRIWEHDPEVLLPERDREDEGAEGEGERPDQANDWEDLVDFYPEGKEEQK